ncbi:MAG TPA: D-alanine--D-alanine ligase family protein [Rubricoccaceae bacterium]|jgi:D-alanine-D-alanine ligase
MPPLIVGVVFGGVSPEHEVSVITSLQAAAALDRTVYTPLPVYISKAGRFYTGEGLLDIERYRDLDALVAGATEVTVQRRPDRAGARLVGTERPGLFRKPFETSVDVLFLGLHGGPGENGAVQGLCETIGAPYTGSGVFGSALGMDKVLTKVVCRDQGIPVVPWVSFRETDWAGSEAGWLDRVEADLGLPVVVKPARLGSSIGISKADTREALDAAIEEALRYDEKVLVERAVTALREVNCSVLGSPREAQASVLEEPVRSTGEALLTFAEKYQRGAKGAKGSPAGSGAKYAGAGAKGAASGAAGMASLDRLIPAPLSETDTAAARAMAVQVFRLFECSGVARIDFLLDDADGQLYFNEINTIPGSLSFYLWEPSGVPFATLLDRMIRLALERHAAEAGRIRSYETNLLSTASLGGLKSAKG